MGFHSENEGRDLVPAHGGLSEPVNRVVPLNQRREFLAEAEELATAVGSETERALFPPWVSGWGAPVRAAARPLAADVRAAEHAVPGR